MSIPVEVDQIATEMERYGTAAFVLTVRDDATPHVAHASFVIRDGVLRCGASRTAAGNVGARPSMSILWPPFEPGGYSMIVDGSATVDGDELVIVPTGGVLHRPAEPQSPAQDVDADACASDCVSIGESPTE